MSKKKPHTRLGKAEYQTSELQSIIYSVDLSARAEFLYALKARILSCCHVNS